MNCRAIDCMHNEDGECDMPSYIMIDECGRCDEYYAIDKDAES